MIHSNRPLYAFIVGINNYYNQNGSIDENRQLLGASDDANLISKSILKSRPDSTIRLINEDTPGRDLRRNSIYVELSIFIRSAPEHSNFLIYFAGHASLVHSKIVLHPSDFNSQIPLHSGILGDDFISFFSKRKGNKLVVFDCCRANIDELEFRTPEYFSQSPKIIADENTLFLFSCKPQEFSYEVISSSGINGGVFSHYFSKMLLSASFKNKPANLNRILKNVTKQTSDYVERQLGKNQNPSILGPRVDAFEI